MQQYYRTITELSRLNEMLLQLYEEAILLKDQLSDPTPINKRFQSRSGLLEVTQPNVFRRYPIALLEVFLILQQHPELKGVRACTIRLIRDHCHLIDEKFRTDLRASSLFMEIMRQPLGVTHELRRMHHYGILAAYLPIFANIVGRMQYDLFHVYTVDEHTLTVIRTLRRFAVRQHAHEFPFCSKIIDSLPKPELLYLAGLFHDIAKGRGGDHSTLGAKDAWDFCQQHGLSDFDSKLISWLVEKHLILSMTAQRKDISDPEVVQAFAEEVGDPTRLDYLYLLTVADTRATNPARWNSWKDALLRELYVATRGALERGLNRPQVLNELIRDRAVKNRKRPGKRVPPKAWICNRPSPSGPPSARTTSNTPPPTPLPGRPARYWRQRPMTCPWSWYGVKPPVAAPRYFIMARIRTACLPSPPPCWINSAWTLLRRALKPPPQGTP